MPGLWQEGKKMKVFIFTALLVSSFCTYAGFPEFKLTNLSGTYENKHGSAFAEYASYNLDVVRIEHKVIHVKFNNVEKNLVLSDNNTSVRLKFDFSFLNVFQALEFDSVNAKSEKAKFLTKIDELGVFIEPSEYILNNLEISSDLTNMDINANEIDMLEGFIMHGNLFVEKIAMKSIHADDIQDDLGRTFPDLRTNRDPNARPLKIPLVGRNFHLTIDKKEFSGKVLLDSWINAWLKLAGSLDYKKNEQLLRITIDKAKLGIFSVRGLLLRKIKKLNMDTVQVDGNVIIVDLGQSVGQGQDGTTVSRK